MRTENRADAIGDHLFCIDVVRAAGRDRIGRAIATICVAALVFALFLFPVGERDRAHPLDVVGFLLLTPGVVAIAYGIRQAEGANGFAALNVWLPLALGAALITAFVVYSPACKTAGSARRTVVRPTQLRPERRDHVCRWVPPLFYQQVRGDSVFATGLLLIPQGVGTMCFILANRRLAGRVDTRLVIAESF